MQHPDRILFRDYLWLFVALGLSSAWCLTAGQRLGATFDEPVYLQRGTRRLADGQPSWAAAFRHHAAAWRCANAAALSHRARVGTAVEPGHRLFAALVIARAMTLLFWWLLLIYGFRAGRMIGGRWGGNLAVAILACEPNLLAHASLATTDIAVTACLMAFLVHYRSGRDARVGRRVIVPGIWFGIALTAKASALVFAPLCMLAVELERWLSAQADGEEALPPRSRVASLWHFCRESLQIGLLGLLVTFIYCGCDWRTEPSFVAWANGLPEGIGKLSMSWLADHLRIFRMRARDWPGRSSTISAATACIFSACRATMQFGITSRSCSRSNWRRRCSSALTAVVAFRPSALAELGACLCRHPFALQFQLPRATRHSVSAALRRLICGGARCRGRRSRTAGG